MTKFTFCLFLQVILLSGFILPLPSMAQPLENRWVFCQNGLDNAAELEKAISLIKTAKKAGFNGIVLASRFASLSMQSEEYIDRLRKLNTACKQHAFDLIPCGFAIGHASALLYKNKDFAAAFPVQNLLYNVFRGVAYPAESLKPHIQNVTKLSLTDATSVLNQSTLRANLIPAHVDALPNSGIVLEDPGKISFIDTIVTHSGQPSLRLENYSYNQSGNARFVVNMGVVPFQSYQISFWYRAEDLPVGTSTMAQVYTTAGNNLLFKEMAQPTTNWQQYTLDFNSLEHSKVLIYLGVWGGQRGKLWIDDLRVTHQKQLLSLIKRQGTPVSVSNADTKDVYSEGSDFSVVESPLGSDQYNLIINPQGAIKDGSRLMVSYYRSYTINDTQISATMSLSDVYEIWKKEIILINTLIKPKAYFLCMDEIRQGGYCDLEKNVNMNELLGDCITKQYSMIKKINADAEIYIWGDMLDPYMGAKNNYCMVRGGFPNSWNFVPKDIHPVAWDYTNRDLSLTHFRNNGFTTMASINIDKDFSDDKLKNWKFSIDNYTNNKGIIYTTWKGDHSKLLQFGKHYFE